MVVTSDVTTIKEAEATLQVMTDQLKVLATTDGLTGLVNRRGFDQALDRELSRSIRNATAFSLLLADVDLFKKFNDQYGHPAGDECLRSVSRALQSGARRPSDTVARYGGEEFVAILPETDEDGAYVVAENLRAKIQKMAIPHAQSPAGVVTISVGLTTLKLGESMAAADLLTRADEALYDAKYAGRNRVMGWRRRYAGGASAGA
jgi:diguanylate cyclase (GGDEF)-like protein